MGSVACKWDERIWWFWRVVSLENSQSLPSILLVTKPFSQVVLCSILANSQPLQTYIYLSCPTSAINMTIDARILAIKDKQEQDVQVMKMLSMVSTRLIPFRVQTFVSKLCSQAVRAVGLNRSSNSEKIAKENAQCRSFKGLWCEIILETSNVHVNYRYSCNHKIEIQF